MNVTHKMNVDLLRPGVEPRIHAVQGDQYTRSVELSLMVGGNAFSLPSGTAAVVRFRKDDGTGGVYNKMPDGTSAYAISGNKVTVCLAPAVLSTPGHVTAAVALSNNGDVLGVFSFRIVVEADPSIGTVESENYFSFETLEDINTALAGFESAIKQKAPAGYGLGTACVKVDSILNISVNGWWLTNGDTPDGNWWVCRSMCANSGNNVEIDACSITGSNRARRSKNTEWGDWEWVNPKMAPDVEYRTSERYNGKTVYRKLIVYEVASSVGVENGGGGLMITHGVQNIDELVEIRGKYKLDGDTMEYPLPAENVSITGVKMATNGTIDVAISNIVLNKPTFTVEIAYTKLT